MQSYEKNIRNFSSQLSRDSLVARNLRPTERKKFDGIILCGMGGSGLAGDVIFNNSKYLGIKVPIVVWKDYGIPPETIFENPLFIFISYSGDTEEVLTGFAEVGSSNACAVGTGGRLKSISNKRSVTFIEIPQMDSEPRQAIGYLTYGALLAIKLKIGGSKIPDLRNIIKPSKLRSDCMSLSHQLDKHIVVVYTDFQHSFLAYNWKIRLNETAKIPAFAGVLPETNHNEIESYQNNKHKLAVLFLTTGVESARIKKRIIITKKVLRRNNTKFFEYTIKGRNKFEKTWNSSVAADWVSLFIAERNKINPSLTNNISEIKKALK